SADPSTKIHVTRYVVRFATPVKSRVMNTRPRIRPDYSNFNRSSGTLQIVRSALATVLAKAEGSHLKTVIDQRWPDNENLQILTRAATSPATTSDAASAALVGISIADTVDLLSPVSATPGLMQNAITLPWTQGTGSVQIQGITVSGSDADFVGE